MIGFFDVDWMYCSTYGWHEAGHYTWEGPQGVIVEYDVTEPGLYARSVTHHLSGKVDFRLEASRALHFNWTSIQKREGWPAEGR